MRIVVLSLSLSLLSMLQLEGFIAFWLGTQILPTPSLSRIWMIVSAGVGTSLWMGLVIKSFYTVTDFTGIQ